MIADREKEIAEFIPAEYWSLDASLRVPGQKKPLVAHYYGRNGKKSIPVSAEETEAVVRELEGLPYEVKELKHGERKKKAPLPFTTSTMQQEASRQLGFSTSKTMRIAQQLYEGVDLKKEGTVGLITYLRTDSTRISDEADAAARAYIGEQFGPEWVGNGSVGNANRNSQDAHEAIRPTDIRRTPANVKESLSRDQFRLYQLIWKRFTASRMAGAVYDTASAKIAAGSFLFTASASRVRFAGFLDVYMSEEDREEGEKTLGKNLEQHFTQPPAHFTEASLVRAMEEQGIGRPSTYAPTITTIMARNYITKEQKNLYITELGEVVNGIMLQAFPQIVDLSFTANMETLLDGVAEGTVEWKTIVRNFYPDLEEKVQNAGKELEHVRIEDQVTDVICENCGRNMVIKYGPHGKFLACPGFPECRNTRPFYEKIGVKCPECGSELVLKRTRRGRRYFGCEKNPECGFMSWDRPSDRRCPVCGRYMIQKGNRLVCSDAACGHKENI